METVTRKLLVKLDTATDRMVAAGAAALGLSRSGLAERLFREFVTREGGQLEALARSGAVAPGQLALVEPQAAPAPRKRSTRAARKRPA